MGEVGGLSKRGRTLDMFSRLEKETAIEMEDVFSYSFTALFVL
jgi:hypothetical protein